MGLAGRPKPPWSKVAAPYFRQGGKARCANPQIGAPLGGRNPHTAPPPGGIWAHPHPKAIGYRADWIVVKVWNRPGAV